MNRIVRTLSAVLLGAGALYGSVVEAAAGVRNEDGVAVIIGNKAYKSDRVPEVSYAHRDAEAFKTYVVDVLGFDPDNVIDLRDVSSAEMAATFGNHKTHKGKIWRYLNPEGGSDVVVFYSGHGVPGVNDKRGYLLPSDADPNAPEINGYSIDMMYKNLGKLVEANSISVFLDACFSGESHKGMLIQSASPVYVKAALPEAEAKMTVLTAATGAQLASWDEKAKHGLFTNHLLDALYGRGDANGDGQVTAKEAKTYLDRKMTRAARRQFGREQQADLRGDNAVVLASADGGFPERQKVKIAEKKPNPQVANVPPAAAQTPPAAPAAALNSVPAVLAPQPTVTGPAVQPMMPGMQTHIATANVNVRAAPSAGGAKLGMVKKDSIATVTGVVQGGDWVAIQYHGRPAYVSARFLRQIDRQEVIAFQQAMSSPNRDGAIRAFVQSYPNSYYTQRIMAIAAERQAAQQGAAQAAVRRQQLQQMEQQRLQQRQFAEQQRRMAEQQKRQQEAETGKAIINVFGGFLNAITNKR